MLHHTGPIPADTSVGGDDGCVLHLRTVHLPSIGYNPKRKKRSRLSLVSAFGISMKKAGRDCLQWNLG